MGPAISIPLALLVAFIMCAVFVATSQREDVRSTREFWGGFAYWYWREYLPWGLKTAVGLKAKSPFDVRAGPRPRLRSSKAKTNSALSPIHHDYKQPANVLSMPTSPTVLSRPPQQLDPLSYAPPTFTEYNVMAARGKGADGTEVTSPASLPKPAPATPADHSHSVSRHILTSQVSARSVSHIDVAVDEEVDLNYGLVVPPYAIMASLTGSMRSVVSVTEGSLSRLSLSSHRQP